MEEQISLSDSNNNRQSKRLKVGRACYTCRAKKIKCDGLRPCMQCKARQRPCSFYKDGSLEDGDQQQKQLSSQQDQPLSEQQNQRANEDDTASANSDNGDTNKSDNDSNFLFAETVGAKFNKLKRRGPLMESRTSNSFATLGDNLRRASSLESKEIVEKLKNEDQSFGSFILWLSEPSLPTRYSGSIEMPSKEIQMQLIDAFFDYRQETFGMLPRFYFYQQLKDKDLFITPLLLNAIYAHSSRFVDIPDCPSSNVFYHRAKRLLDDFLDLPRVSTVVALGLLGMYELTPDLYRPGSQHCRAWMFSGMACRMCLELGLYNDSNVCKTLSEVEIELRRRIFWACYELDKFQSGGWERPWIISKGLINTKQPSPLADESETEQEIIAHWHARIQFLFLVEDGLHAMLYNSPSPTIQLSDKAIQPSNEQAIASLSSMHMRYQQWLRSLPENMQWTPTTNMSIQEVLELPEPRPVVLYTHLYYNTAVIEVLLRLPSNAYTQFHCRITAASLTQLASYALDKPQFVVKFDFVAHALLCAIKVYIRHLNESDIHLAQQAWGLFDKSIRCLGKTQKYAVIPNCTKFLQQVQTTFGIELKPSTTLEFSEKQEEQEFASTFEKPIHDSTPIPSSPYQLQQSFQPFQLPQLPQLPQQHEPLQPQPQPHHFQFSHWREPGDNSNTSRATNEHWQQRPFSSSPVVLRSAQNPLLENYADMMRMPLQTNLNMVVASQTDLYPMQTSQASSSDNDETAWRHTNENTYTNRDLGTYLPPRQHYED
ncbi:hypothetical protein K501DRAFT_284749 [Backusella circina FSU 941]|nr:hypothetical protein K501DRAFT_284749 [Backusella circina FSU 941]